MEHFEGQGWFMCKLVNGSDSLPCWQRCTLPLLPYAMLCLPYYPIRELNRGISPPLMLAPPMLVTQHFYHSHVGHSHADHSHADHSHVGPQSEEDEAEEDAKDSAMQDALLLPTPFVANPMQVPW